MDANEADLTLTLHVLDLPPKGLPKKGTTLSNPWAQYSKFVQDLFKGDKSKAPVSPCLLVHQHHRVFHITLISTNHQMMLIKICDDDQNGKQNGRDTNQIDENIRELHLWRSPD